MTNGLKKAQKSVAKYSKHVVTAAATAGAAITTLYAKFAVGAASDLSESLSKSDQVFGQNSAVIKSWAENAARSFGQSKQQAVEAASTMGNMFVAMGVASGKAANMSMQIVELAGDLASFNNTSPEDAIMAIGAALRGESEPIRRYGVLLNEATLKQRALSMGLYAGKGALDPSTKAMAAYAEILSQTTTAQGDFERTADGLANTQRTLSALWSDAAAEVGEGLLPVVQDLASALKDIDFESIASGIRAGASDLSYFAKEVKNVLEPLIAINPVIQAGFMTAGGRPSDVAALKKQSEMLTARFGSLGFLSEERGFGELGGAVSGRKSSLNLPTKAATEWEKSQQETIDAMKRIQMRMKEARAELDVPVFELPSSRASDEDVADLVRERLEGQLEMLSRPWESIASGVNSMQARGLGMGAENQPRTISTISDNVKGIREELRRRAEEKISSTF